MIKFKENYYALKYGFRKYNFLINGEDKFSTNDKDSLIKYFKEKNLPFENKIRTLRSTLVWDLRT